MPPFLSPAAERELLRRARATLRREIGCETDDHPTTASPALVPPHGAFVTLRTSEGELRGCIGRVRTEEPLWKLIDHLVVESARNDPRFAPVRAKEVPSLLLHLSILSEIVPIESPCELVVGTHGIQVESAGRSGLFLPEVALDMGWDRDELIRQACRKASIPEKSIESGKVRLSIFYSQKIEETPSISS